MCEVAGEGGTDMAGKSDRERRIRIVEKKGNEGGNESRLKRGRLIFLEGG